MAVEIDRDTLKLFERIDRIFETKEDFEPFEVTRSTARQLKDGLERSVMQVACVNRSTGDVRMVIVSSNDKMISDFKKANFIKDGKRSKNSSGKAVPGLMNVEKVNTFNFTTGSTYTFSGSRDMIYKVLSIEMITPGNLENLSKRMKSVSEHFRTNRNRKR